MSLQHAQGEQLAQSKPSGTSAVTLFTAGELRVEITGLFATVVEGTAGNVDIAIYHDDDGTTYDDTTVVFVDQLAVNDPAEIFQAQHPGSGIFVKPGGSIGVKVSVADDVNFTLYGITETLADRVRPRV